MNVTPALLVAAVGCTQQRADAYASVIDEACRLFHITTPKRLAAFFAQVGHESGSLRYKRELWGPTAAQRGYEGRRDLGNVYPGDGERYMGRGFIQCTGRANYRAMRDGLRGVLSEDVPDFEADPEALESPRWAALSAGYYWHMRSLNALADTDSFVALTKAVNGGLNGLEDRKARWAKAKRAIAAFEAPAGADPEPIPVDRPPPGAPPAGASARSMSWAGSI